MILICNNNECHWIWWGEYFWNLDIAKCSIPECPNYKELDCPGCHKPVKIEKPSVFFSEHYTIPA